MKTPLALEVSGVSVRYGRAEAVADASFVARSGEITAIVGPNGAGKSSLLNAVMAVNRASSGKVNVSGQAVDRLDTTGRMRAGLVLVPQGRQIFPRMTVRENLQIVADCAGVSGTSISEAIESFPVLEARRDVLAGMLSGGEQQMLALARAMICKPKILLLDEPTLGLAPVIVEQIIRRVARFAADGTAVVLAEPSMRLIRSQVNNGYVMVRGRIVAMASSAEELEKEYLHRMGVHTQSAPSGERHIG